MFSVQVPTNCSGHFNIAGTVVRKACQYWARNQMEEEVWSARNAAGVRRSATWAEAVQRTTESSNGLSFWKPTWYSNLDHVQNTCKLFEWALGFQEAATLHP